MRKTLLSSLLLCSAAFAEQPTKVNYPSNFQVENGWDLFLYGDYLYWIAQEDSLFYAQTGGDTSGFDGHLKKVHPDWDSGLRIGLGLNFAKEGYDTIAYWTWFATDASNSTSSSAGNILPLWAFPDDPAAASSTFAKGKWELDLNQFDLEWGRSSWFGGHFSLRPFFGLRALLLQQNLKNHYDYSTSPVTFGKLQANSDVHGGGLRAGADARFFIPKGFSIYGTASGSLLYARFCTDFRLREDTTMIARAKDRFNRGISSLQISLGLAWDSHFAGDRCHIELHAGWEQNQWFSVNQMNHFLQGVGSGVYYQENGNLSLQGLVVGGRFDF